LLDFGLANFLDRISFKAPKSADKIAKYRQSMAKFERPINELDFKNEKPEILRKEEEYLYKYMQMKPERKPKRQADPDAEESEDPELEEFAAKEIEAQMKRMQGGDIDDDEDLSGFEDEAGESDMGEDQDAEVEDDFFSGEDLQEVELD